MGEFPKPEGVEPKPEMNEGLLGLEIPPEVRSALQVPLPISFSHLCQNGVHSFCHSVIVICDTHVLWVSACKCHFQWSLIWVFC